MTLILFLLAGSAMAAPEAAPAVDRFEHIKSLFFQGQLPEPTDGVFAGRCFPARDRTKVIASVLILQTMGGESGPEFLDPARRALSFLAGSNPRADAESYDRYQSDRDAMTSTYAFYTKAREPSWAVPMKTYYLDKQRHLGRWVEYKLTFSKNYWVLLGTDGKDGAETACYFFKKVSEQVVRRVPPPEDY